MDEAVRCHRLCLMRDGRRAAVGSPAALARPLADRVVNVHVAAPERAIGTLRGAPLVASTTQLGDTVHVLLRPGAPPASQAAAVLVRHLVDAGLADARAEASPPNLEDVFVALLFGERLDAEPAAGGA
jgi:hypothetical protein